VSSPVKNKEQQHNATETAQCRNEKEQIEGKLHVQLTLGQPASNGGIDREDLILTLSVANRSFGSLGTSRGYFENELLDIHMQLPEGMYMRTYLFCERSDYSPLGNGLFDRPTLNPHETDAGTRIKSPVTYTPPAAISVPVHITGKDATIGVNPLYNGHVPQPTGSLYSRLQDNDGRHTRLR